MCPFQPIKHFEIFDLVPSEGVAGDGGFETMQDSQSEAESEDYFDAGPFSHQVESTCPTEIEFLESRYTELLIKNQMLLDQQYFLEEENQYLKTFLEKNIANLDELELQVQKLKEKMEMLKNQVREQEANKN